jgi:hypothetical protein
MIRSTSTSDLDNGMHALRELMARPCSAGAAR